MPNLIHYSRNRDEYALQLEGRDMFRFRQEANGNITVLQGASDVRLMEPARLQSTLSDRNNPYPFLHALEFTNREGLREVLPLSDELLGVAREAARNNPDGRPTNPLTGKLDARLVDEIARVSRGEYAVIDIQADVAYKVEAPNATTGMPRHSGRNEGR